jgi:hypothetical protein
VGSSVRRFDEWYTFGRKAAMERTRWKVVLRRAGLVLAGVVAGAIALGAWLLGTDWGHERLRRMIVAGAPDVLHGSVEIAAIEGGPLRTWRIVAPRVLDEAGAEVLGADAIELRLGWGEGGLGIVEARLVAPRASLRPAADGRLNLVALWREPPAGLPLDERPEPARLRVASLKIERGHVRWEGDGGGPVVTLDDLAGEIGLETAEGTTHLRVGWLSAILLKGPVARLTADATFGPRLAELTHGELRVGDSVLEMTARYARPEGEPQRLDAEILRAQLAVPEVVRWLVGARLPDGATLRGSVHGTPADLRLKLELLAGAAGSASVAGVLRLAARPAYELALGARALDLDAFGAGLPQTKLDLDAVLRGEGLAPAAAEGAWTVTARGDIGGLAAGELKLPVTLHLGALSFAGASWPAAGIADASGEWSPGRLVLHTPEGTFGSLVMRLLDVEDDVHWEYRVGADAPERLLLWRPGAGWNRGVPARSDD